MYSLPKILLIDDRPESLFELDLILNGLNVEIAHAASREQAFRLTLANEYCLAVVNVEMPGMEGYALLAQFRSRPTTARLPVIVLCPGYPDEAMLRQAYAAGAADVLPRSLAQAVLAIRAQALIALSQQRRAEDERAARGRSPTDPLELFKWLSVSVEQIARAMASSPDMTEVPDLVLEQLPMVVPYERGSILLRDGSALRIVAQRGFPPGWPISEARIAIRQGDIFQQIVETRQALLIDDVTTTTAWHQAEGLPLNRSWLGVPLVSKDHVIGMISLTRKEASAFRPEEVLLIRASASQAAVALVNAQLLGELKRFNEQLEQLVQKRTEELKQAYAKLEKIDQTKTSFISVAAHELRTPLTLIKGYASLLSSLVKDNNEASELVEGIINGENRLLDVVNSMVDVTKIDSQGLTLRKSSVNLWVILKIIRSEYDSALLERRLRLSIEGVEGLPSIQADTEQMAKVFRQLVGNAIKFTPDGGTITISGRRVVIGEPGQARHALEIQVRDTGVGIDPADRDLIFDKFYQTGPVELHSSGKTKFKGGGPGLGLAIARGILQAHGGQIWVESPGYDEVALPGSCFHIVLPQEG